MQDSHKISATLKLRTKRGQFWSTMVSGNFHFGFEIWYTGWQEKHKSFPDSCKIVSSHRYESKTQLTLEDVVIT